MDFVLAQRKKEKKKKKTIEQKQIMWIQKHQTRTGYGC